jgi:hypothetical protein
MPLKHSILELDIIDYSVDIYRIPHVRVNTLFPEPSRLDDLLLIEPFKSMLIDWVENLEEMPTAVLLHGPAGCGKTTVARIVSQMNGFVMYDDWVQNFCLEKDDCKILYLNSSQIRQTGVASLKKALEIFMTATASYARTLLVIDEAHDLTEVAVNLLKQAAETQIVQTKSHSQGGNILLLSTQPVIGDDQLMTRVFPIDCGKFDANQLMKYTLKCLDDAGVLYEEKEVSALWDKTGSPRGFLNMLNPIAKHSLKHETKMDLKSIL